MTRSTARRGGFGGAGPVPAVTLCLTLLPLVLAFVRNGYSSGDDLPFHLGSWEDAARRLRHGLYPQWDTAAAYGAGEPRFIFYPPLSWLLGACLRMFASSAHASEWFVCLAMAACWLGMYVAARQWTSVSASLLAATVHAAAPYMLFNGLQRAAYGELLASAFLPPLFAACVASVPAIPSIAFCLALLWLTNVPTAILGSYLVLLVAVLRLALRWDTGRPSGNPALREAGRFATAAALGLLLPVFFLAPALHQRHWVQLDAAFAGGQGFRDNFLLRHTAHTSRQTLHAVTLMALVYATAIAFLLLAGFYTHRQRMHSHGRVPHRNRCLLRLLAMLTTVSLVLLTPLSAPVWQHVPELSVLQFPWRLLGVLTLVLACTLALVADQFRLRQRYAVAASAVLAALLIPTSAGMYWRHPLQLEAGDKTRAEVAAQTQLRPTPEYTPQGAKNLDLQAMATPECDTPVYARPIAPNSARAFASAFHANLRLSQAGLCTLPVRDYPLWTVLVNGQATPHTYRSDGRITLTLPAGSLNIEVRWLNSIDRVAGWCVSILALGLLILLQTKRKQT